MCGWRTRISIQINPQRSWIMKDTGLLGFQRTLVSSSQTVDLVFLYFIHFYFYFLFVLFSHFSILEQLGLGLEVIGHTVTSVTI